MNKYKFSVVIPSKDGLEILLKYLPVISNEVSRADGELIIVDDCSTDATAATIPELFPSAKVIKRTGNPGFCHAVNLGMNKASGKYLMLLNNDTIPSKNAFVELVEELEKVEENIAVVVPKILRPDNTDDSRYCWTFARGLAITGEGISKNIYPSGACSLWRKEVWHALSGLSTRYAPIYWEDADLGVRMQKAGFNMKRCGSILVKHDHAITMGYSLAAETLRERNRFIFMDSNCNSFTEKVLTFFWLPFHLTVALIKRNKAFIHGFKNYCKWKHYG